MTRLGGSGGRGRIVRRRLAAWEGSAYGGLGTHQEGNASMSQVSATDGRDGSSCEPIGAGRSGALRPARGTSVGPGVAMRDLWHRPWSFRIVTAVNSAMVFATTLRSAGWTDFHGDGPTTS